MARQLIKQKRSEKCEHILEIATEVFSEKGYSGALTDEIAERAGISKRSMYYYIGDKDMLYEAVIKNLLEQATIHLLMDHSKNESPEHEISRLIRGMAQFAKLHQFHAIVMRELFAGGGNLPKSLRTDIDHYLETFAAACKRATNDTDNLNVSPIVVAWMVFAFFLHWDITMPFVYKDKDCTQYNAIAVVGKNVNEQLVAEIEKLVFKMLHVGKQPMNSGTKDTSVCSGMFQQLLEGAIAEQQQLLAA